MLSARAFTTSKHLVGGVRGPMHAAHTASMRQWMRSAAGEATVPWMGDSLQILFKNGGLGAKVTVVVVGDGFAANDQAAFNTAVDNLLTSGMFTHDFYATHKSAFNLLRINLVSIDSGVGTKTYNAAGKVTSQVDRNTALGAFYNGDWAHCWVEFGPQTQERLNKVLSIWAPDHREVIVLLNNPGFGGCGGGGVATLPLGVTWSTFAHELGHALGGLGDEYHQDSKTYTDGEPTAPNLTKNTNRQTLKWAPFLHAGVPIPTGGDDYTAPKPAGWDDNQDVGLFEGGGGSFTTGIYRPVVDCRMRSNDPAFCPVCASTMSSQIAPRGLTGQEVADVAAGETYVRMLVRMDRGEPQITDAREVPGALVEPDTLTAGLVTELWVGDRRVSVASHPDAGISRSFSEPGPGGPSEHHVYLPEAYDLVVRVPTREIRGIDPSSLSLNVVKLDSPVPLVAPHPNQLGALELHEQPELKATKVGGTNRIAEASLPDSLLRIIRSTAT